jgi:site-specific DNA recombinase
VTALGYARRSKESGARTVSLEDQRERIAAYCTAQGWQLAEIVVDDGVSGGRRERLDRIAARVRATRARAVVVYHLDRFARDVAGLLDSVRGFSRRGVDLHVVGRGRVEVDSASGFLLTGVEGLMAEHYRRLIGEKTRDALARLRAAGRRYSGAPPYGYRLAGDNRGLEPDAAEQARVMLVRQLAPGRSLRVLAAELAARGVLARNGRPFAPMTLSRLVAAQRNRGSCPDLLRAPATGGGG